ncbi:MAG: c-type cytochrome [Pseudomonadota bacterium]
MLKPCLLTASMILCATSALADSTASETDAPALVAENADFEAAQKIFKKSCRACHGNKAQGAASYPKLSDKDPEYIAEKLAIYRSGERIGPNSILMIQHAKKLSDQDIVNLSFYVANAFD